MKQVERKGKSKQLPPEKLKKWQEEYDNINRYLKENYKNFCCSYIVRRNRYIDLEVFQRFVEEEKNDLIALANQAVKDGNADDLQWYCWCMHAKYMCMWKVKQDEKRAA